MADFLTDTPAKVKGPVFIGVIWGSTALSFAFVSMRIFSRIYAFRHLFVDDYLTIAAWLMLLAKAIIWQTQLEAMYAQFQLSIGNLAPTPEVLDRNIRFMRAEVAILFLFYGCLWSIKAAFLVFFRRISGKGRPWRIWFWCVVGLVVATCAVCIGDIPYQCLLKDQLWIMENCTLPSAILFQYRTFYVNAVLDVFTDLLIISLPVFLLWNVRIPIRRKLALIGLLSLTVVIMVFAIVRVAVVVVPDRNADITWLWMWSFIEITVANIITCLAAFRQLYVKQEPKTKNTYYLRANSR